MDEEHFPTRFSRETTPEIFRHFQVRAPRALGNIGRAFTVIMDNDWAPRSFELVQPHENLTHN
eukprot:9716967-Lingulodinium_polyedra.AAC.1